MIAETNWQQKISQEWWSRNLWKLSVENSTSCMREAHKHMGSCPGYALLNLHEKATKPRKDEFRERLGRIIERTLAGEAKTETYKDRIAERKRVREKRGARIERGTRGCEPGNKNDEQVAVRHADASGGYIMENQHEEKRMRGIRVNKRGSGARTKNNWTNGGRQNDLSVKLRIHQHLPIHVFSWNML